MSYRLPAGLVFRPEFQNPGGHTPAPVKTGESSTSTETKEPAEGGQRKQAVGSEACLQPLLMVAAFGAIAYFLIIRPQQKQEKAHREMVSALKKGDKVIMSDGLHGTIANANEQTVTLSVGDNVKLTFNRSSVAQVMRSDGKMEGEAKS